MITIAGVDKEYKTIFRRGYFRTEARYEPALKNINLKFESPEIVGLVGNNGAGKSTLMKLICGLLYPSKGDIVVAGETPFKKSKSLLSQLAFLSGRKDSLIWDLPVSDSLKFHGDIYELDKNKTISRYGYLSELFDAVHLLNKQARALSLGERMKCELIKSLLHNPRIILLDEPTIGLDLSAQVSFRKYIKLANKNNNSLIILSSHNMEDISDTCSRMVGLSKGRVVFDDVIERVYNPIYTNLEYRISYENIIEQSFHELLCDISELPERLNELTNTRGIKVLEVEKNSKTFSQSIMDIISNKSADHV